MRNCEFGCFTHKTRGCNFNKRMRHFANTTLKLSFARLPGNTAQTIKLNLCIFRAIARQEVKIFNG